MTSIRQCLDIVNHEAGEANIAVIETVCGQVIVDGYAQVELLWYIPVEG
jgi:hypothetical protein